MVIVFLVVALLGIIFLIASGGRIYKSSSANDAEISEGVKAVKALDNRTPAAPKDDPGKPAEPAPKPAADIDLNADGSPVIGNAAYEMRGATIGGGLSGGAKGVFSLGVDLDLAVAGELQDQLLPWAEPFEVVGNKWKFAKNATVKLSPDKTSVAVDASNGKTNLASLKLTYTSKKGLFKGSFKAYALEHASNGKIKLKKYTVNVTGFVVDGKGYGQATCKKPAGGPWAVTVR